MVATDAFGGGLEGASISVRQSSQRSVEVRLVEHERAGVGDLYAVELARQAHQRGIAVFAHVGYGVGSDAGGLGCFAGLPGEQRRELAANCASALHMRRITSRLRREWRC